MVDRDELTQLLRRRVLTVPPLPPEFDQFKAPSARLIQYGLAPRPDPEIQRAAFESWSRMYGKNLSTTSWDFSALASSPGYRIRSTQTAGRGRWESSRNWAGAVITARSGPTSTHTKPQLFGEVSGRWSVPKPSLPPTHAAADVTYMCSTWLGLDGHRLATGSLPQVGTTQILEVVGGVPQPPRIEVWWQWWMRGHRHPPQLFLNFPVRFGDQISARVVLLDIDHVLINIRNLTQMSSVFVADVLAPNIVFGPGSPSGPGIPPFVLPVPARGLTAQWIAERPTSMATDDMFPLPAFTSVSFEGCIATEPGGATRLLEAARYVRMIERRSGPARTRTIARPRRVRDQPEIVIEYRG